MIVTWQPSRLLPSYRTQHPQVDVTSTRPPNSQPPFCLCRIMTKLIPSKTQSQVAYLPSLSLQWPPKKSKTARPTSVSCETTPIPSHITTDLSNTYPRRVASHCQRPPILPIHPSSLITSFAIRKPTLSASLGPPTSTPNSHISVSAKSSEPSSAA